MAFRFNNAILIGMKTVAKINPDLEYKNAASYLDTRTGIENEAASAKNALNKLYEATKVLMEREDRRRGKGNNRKDYKKKGRRQGESRAETSKLPSDKYPNIDVIEKEHRWEEIPVCDCCGEKMTESGLFNTAEKLEVEPKNYIIERHKRVKYNCKNCHGSMKNTPSVPSIVPTSNYGDSLIIDVALSKYCDLIPIERYAGIAGRENLFDLPPQTLIGLTHHLANFLEDVYQSIKKEVQDSSVIHGDETPHRMLEGDSKKMWYLWGFFSQMGCYFEIHNTRSGDIATDFLKDSNVKYLLTDGYGGYAKAIRELKDKYNKNITSILCNAHAFRYFVEASDSWAEETKDIINLYQQIFTEERENPQNKEVRQQMKIIFEKISLKCNQLKDTVMPGSGLAKAVNYFLRHYNELIACTSDPEIPLDNNFAERNLRPSVVGRKTWYGTHSKRGAKTNAILFSLVQSCLINNINPRKYFPWVVTQVHQKKTLLTPFQYARETQ